MGEPLSPDRVFDFLVDEPEPHPAYDFFVPEPLLGHAGNPNNNNGWIEVDVPLLGELGAGADELMVVPIVDEIAKPIDDDSEGFDKEEVWKVNKEWLMAPVTPPLMPTVPPSSVYEVGGPFTTTAEVSDVKVAAGITIGEIGPRILLLRDRCRLWRPKWFMPRTDLSRLALRWSKALQAVVQQRDTQIQQLQTMVSEMSSRENRLM
ncbi:hypothetical protein Tco_0888249 [Tanacetum coccineum]